MKPPSEYIAPFDEDRQTGLLQTLPVGGVVTEGLGVVVVAVGDIVSLEDAVTDGDDEALAELLGVDDDALAELLGVLDDDALAEWLAELDGGADVEVEADAVVDFVADGDALMVLAGGVVTPSLSTVKVARRNETAPCDHFKTAVIVCRPSASLPVSNGRAEPSLAVPLKSKGGTESVRTDARDRHESSK